MKFLSVREKLAKSLGLSQRVIAKNFTLPILESALIETEKGQMKISATNLEMAIRCWVQGKVEKEGSLTVPAAFLLSIVQNLNTEKITLETKGSILHITAEQYRGTIKGQNAEDFPSVPEVKGEVEAVFEGTALYQGLAQLQNIVTISEARPEISGVYVILEGNKGVLAATDSFRLGEKKISLKGELKGKAEARFIVPLRAVQELIRILEGGQQDVVVRIDANQAMFMLPHVQLTTRLIDGVYPDYAKILPKEFTTETVFERGALLDKVRQVSVFSGKTNDIRLHFDAEKQIIVLSASSSEVGEGTTELSATIQGESVDIVFNYRYLIDGLQNLSDDKVRFQLNANTKPSLLKAVGDVTYQYIVMPIRE